MAVFKSEKYPRLSLHDGEVEWAKFEDGVFESSDESVIERLRSEGAAELGVTEDEGAEDEGTKPYAKWNKGDLEAEVAKRNEGREDDAKIAVEGNGTKADLAAALEADDAASDED